MFYHKGKDFIKILLITALPLIIGSLVYISWRPNNLLMFSWFEYLGVMNSILVVRNSLSSFNPPNWVIFWLPNALWSFSFMTILYWLWGKQNNKIKYFFLLLPFVFGFFMELGQLFNILPGTFDIGDIIAHLIGVLLAIFLIRIFIFHDCNFKITGC